MNEECKHQWSARQETDFVSYLRNYEKCLRCNEEKEIIMADENGMTFHGSLKIDKPKTTWEMLVERRQIDSEGWTVDYCENDREMIQALCDVIDELREKKEI